MQTNFITGINIIHAIVKIQKTVPIHVFNIVSPVKQMPFPARIIVEHVTNLLPEDQARIWDRIMDIIHRLVENCLGRI